MKTFLQLWEQMVKKAILDENKINMEELFMLAFLIKPLLFYLGLLDIK